MAEIDDSDWDRITSAFRKARPGVYPDRSLIIDEMVSLYVSSLNPPPITIPKGTCPPTFQGLPPSEPLSLSTKQHKTRTIPDSKGHIWKITPQGEIDDMAYDVDDPDSGGGHNGPMCIVCGDFFCHHCQKSPDEPCPGLPPGMEVAVIIADNGDQVQVIRPVKP